jgi:hypothetical protein
MDRFLVSCVTVLSLTVLLAIITGDTVGLTGLRSMMV